LLCVCVWLCTISPILFTEKREWVPVVSRISRENGREMIWRIRGLGKTQFLAQNRVHIQARATSVIWKSVVELLQKRALFMTLFQVLKKSPCHQYYFIIISSIIIRNSLYPYQITQKYFAICILRFPHLLTEKHRH